MSPAAQVDEMAGLLQEREHLTRHRATHLEGHLRLAVPHTGVM